MSPRWAVLLLALPVLLIPICNPDLFWHLSAGRWIAANHAVPRVDFLSFTAAGLPWSDFEWLSQLFFHWVHGLSGFAGLWALKALLLAACAAVIDGVLRLHEKSGVQRAAALLLWSAGIIASSDIRPELFSLLLFLALLLELERLRLGKIAHPFWNASGLFCLFALWANLHAGFIFGLLLLACCAAGELLGRGPKALRDCFGWGVAAFCGTLCNPYGLGPYRVLLDHWLRRAEFQGFIQEWQPTAWVNAFHWPFWVLLGALLYKLFQARKRELPLGLTLASLYFGFGAVAHTRLSVYFACTAVPLLFILAGPPAARLRYGAVLYAGFLVFTLPSLSWRSTFDDRHVPRRAAAFLGKEYAVTSGLRAYNPWEWGGYLGWRLYPWYKVFGDGRYLFHSQLTASAEAVKDPGRWKDFLEENRLNAALLHNLDVRFATRRGYRDGTFSDFARPWYLAFMPRESWALVYWDEKALYFVSRRAVPKKWLEEHEYRWLRPKDDAAFADALKRGEIPGGELRVERERHAKELAEAL